MSINTIIPFVISFLVSLALMPAIRVLSIRTNLVVFPRSDRWHRKPTPTLGGIGIFIAFITTLLVIYLFQDNQFIINSRWSIILGIIIIFILGIYDDLKPIKPPVKLTFQILAATIVIFFGNNTINFFPWPIANILLTFFWLVGITNAINLLDNMDGLAGGVAFIASGFLSMFFVNSGHYDLLIISLAIAGSTLGFLVFNFPPARIFMGDSGSLVLGFSLAALAVAQRTKASDVLAIIGVPLLIFLLPIFDTGLVMITRILRGQSPAIGGTDHTSHRLVAFGLSERQALLVLYGIAIISGFASIGLEALDYDLSLILVPILLIILSLGVAYLSRMKVVSVENTQQSGFTRWIVKLTYKRRIFELFFDLLLIGVSFYMAFWTYYGFDMTPISMSLFQSSWPVALGITYAAFYLFGVYRGVWRYIGIDDLMRFVGAGILSGLVSLVVINYVYPSGQFPGGVFLLFALFVIVGLAASRSSFLILDRLYSRQFRRSEKQHILLFGAGDAGEITLRWILRNPAIGYRVAGFLDEDPLKWGSNIHGVSILGGVENFEQYIDEKHITGVIASAEHLLDSPSGEKLKDVCSKKDIWLRVLRFEFELIE